MLVLTLLLYIVVLLTVLQYLQFRWRHRRVLAVAALLPCPPALPLLGNALLFRGGLSSMTNQMIKYTTQFKELFCIWAGPVPIFIVSEPADVQVILNSSNTLEKDDVYSFGRPFLGNGLLTAPVPIWKKYRRLMNPLLHPSNVDHFLPVFNDVARHFVNGLTESKTPLDPRHAIFDATLDAVIGTVIARNPLTTEMKKDISYIIDLGTEIFLERFFKVWLHPEWTFKIAYRRELNEMLKIMNEGVVFINKEWEKEKSKRMACPEANKRQTPESTSSSKCPARNLVDVCYENEDSDVTEDHEWKDEVTTILLGATDTMVAALSFLMVTLANFPEVQNKIVAEIKEVMGEEGISRDVTVADISAMKYLGQVIMESMRFHGNVPLILRKATKDTKLSGFTLPAGSRVLVPLQAMGWNSNNFPNPEQFLPERFAPASDGDSRRHPYSYMPFSGGPRCCIGKTYAMMFMKTVMVHVLRKCVLESQVRLEDIVYEMKMVMFSKTPVMLTFESRYNSKGR